jgi:hypothetical protein
MVCYAQSIPHDIVGHYSDVDLSGVWAVIEMEPDGSADIDPRAPTSSITTASKQNGRSAAVGSTMRLNASSSSNRGSSRSSSSIDKKTKECNLRQPVSVSIRMHALSAPDTRNFR